MKKQEIRIVSKDARYRKEPYPATPIYNHHIGNYMTGQHYDPKKPETKNYLTKDQIENKKPLTPEQAKLFPYVIYADQRYPILNLRKFDLSKNSEGGYNNPKHKAEYDFFLLTNVVSKSETEFMPGTHFFYIEDKELEAKKRVSKRDRAYEAEKLLRENADINTYRNIALLMNYRVEEFRMDVNVLSESLIRDGLYEACEKYPDEVTACFGDAAKDELFFLKLEYYGIIRRKGKSFYDDAKFLGDTIEEIQRFSTTKEGSPYLSRWKNLLVKHEDPKVSTSSKKEKEADYYQTISLISTSIFNRDIKDAEMHYQKAVMLDKNGPELPQMLEQIEALRNDLAEEADAEHTKIVENNDETEKTNDPATPPSDDNKDNPNDNNNDDLRKVYEQDLMLKEVGELYDICKKGRKAKKYWEGKSKEEVVAYLVTLKFGE